MNSESGHIQEKAADAPTAAEKIFLPNISSSFMRLKQGLTILFESKIATIGFSVICFWFLVALVSLFWTPYNPNESLFIQNLPPNWTNLLGTDHLGRDILSRLMTGSQVILIKTRLPWFDLSVPGGVAIWGVVGSVMLGTLLGLNSGYRGGNWDRMVMYVIDAMVAFPRIILYLVLILAFGQSDLVVIFAITVTGAPGVARLVRGLALDIKTREFVKAAETRAETKFHIMFKEILPNTKGPVIVDAMFRLGYAIFTIGTLGFLGIGLQPPDPDWGSMVNEARKMIFINQWSVIWPAFAVASLVISLNFLADGLNEELSRYQR